MGSTSPIRSATVTSGVANFSKNRSSRCNHAMGVLSPCWAISSLAYLLMGASGSSLISEPSTTGTHSSKSCVIWRAKRVFACPRSPSKFMLWPERMARSTSGITVCSYPNNPSKVGVPLLIRARKFRASSSCIELGVYAVCFNSPMVLLCVIYPNRFFLFCS